MKFKFVFTLYLTISTLQLFSQNPLPENYTTTLALFIKFEKKLERTQQKEINEKRFISPVDEAVIFLEVLKKEAPDLYIHTDCYTKSLLAILEKRDFSKNQKFCVNIVRVLYHLKIDNYIKLLNKIYLDYKLNRVSKKIFLDATINFYNHYSNLLIVNYKNPQLQTLLKKISSDNEIISKVRNDYPGFLDAIQDIISGALFNEFQTTQKGWVFVYDIPESESELN